MKKIRLRALVLAAGHGKRLRPLTAFLPKPLLPIRGKPVAAYTLGQLAALGCEGVAVNLFHQAAAIREALGESCSGLPITYSEERQLMGTLGALAPLRSFLGAAELVLVVNGDSLCRWPLRKMLRRHLRSGADATLLVSSHADPAPFGGGVGVKGGKKIVSLRPNTALEEESRRRVFMGAHILSPTLLNRVPDGPADIIADLYEPLLREGGRIAALETGRKWYDLGQPERYRQGVLHWGRRRGWVAGTAEVAADARVQRSVVEGEVRVAPKCEVVGSVVLSKARLGRGCRVIDSIVGPGVDLPGSTAIERRMVTTVRADAGPTERGSVVGSLVYEPI